MGLGRLLRNPSSSRRLDTSSETALAASIHNLRLEESGWITLKEAKDLFSEMDDQYAFGEMDDQGKRKIESFAAHQKSDVEFMPTEDRVYFTRK
jgi:hypothetical protein